MYWLVVDYLNQFFITQCPYLLFHAIVADTFVDLESERVGTSYTVQQFILQRFYRLLALPVTDFSCRIALLTISQRVQVEGKVCYLSFTYFVFFHLSHTLNY